MNADVLLVLAAGLLGGFLDASVGGGGMVLVPALFAAFPATPHALLMGTNKLAATPGMGVALWRYARSGHVPWRIATFTVVPYAASAFAGALAAQALSSEAFRLLVPLMLAAMLAYVLSRRDFGVTGDAPAVRTPWLACGIGLVLGFYEGFFGPGVGMLLIVAYVRFYGLDFMRATAAARMVNFAGCAVAAATFGWNGGILWTLAAGIAIAYTAGAWVGTRVAIARGSRWLRQVFVVVASLLIARTLWDASKAFLH